MRVGACALALTLAAGALQAAPVELDAQAMRQLAYVALHEGFAEKALDYTAALLIRDPSDTTALIIKARALRALGRYAESEEIARKAWASAKDDPGRYGSAITLAQALSLQDRRTMAQLWLRRAAQYAPNPQARARAEQDFNYVRSQNPLTLQFDVSVQPSNNVNGGSRESVFDFYGYPLPVTGDQQALPGLATAIGVQGSYRLSESAVARSALTFSASVQGAILSEKGHDMAPAAKNSDYTLGTVELGWTRRGLIGENFGLLSTDLSLGHNWYGGTDLSDYLRGSLSFQKSLGTALTGTLTASFERQWQLDNAARNSIKFGLTGGLTKRQKNGDEIGFRLGASRTLSDVFTVDHSEVSANVTWQIAKPVAGLKLDLNLGAKVSNYESFFFEDSGRRDLRVGASLNAVVDKIDYYGFSPVLSLDLSQTNSNFGLFSSRDIGLGLSVRSNF